MCRYRRTGRRWRSGRESHSNVERLKFKYSPEKTTKHTNQINEIIIACESNNCQYYAASRCIPHYF